jgi:hypothetical protein
MAYLFNTTWLVTMVRKNAPKDMGNDKVGDADESAACSHMMRCHISAFHPPNRDTIMLRIRICFVVNIGRQKENGVRAQELITDNRGGLLSRYRTSLLAYIAHKHTAIKYSVGSKVGMPCVGQGNVRQLVSTNVSTEAIWLK